jgi:hypothetical protein
MKLVKKEWKLVMTMLFSLLIILIIHCMNKSKEGYQNNNTNDNDNGNNNIAELKTALAVFSKVQEDRIQNIKVEGIIPDVQIKYNIMPRTIDNIEGKTLEELETILKAYQENMDYIFTVNDQEHNFIDISVKPHQQSVLTSYQRLTNKFIDKGINTQIQGLKDTQNLIKYSNPMDRFYKFNKETGKLDVNNEEELVKDIPPEGENGELNSSNNKNNLNNLNNINEGFVSYHKRFW